MGVEVGKEGVEGVWLEEEMDRNASEQGLKGTKTST